jgi:hypothetical protein
MTWPKSSNYDMVEVESTRKVMITMLARGYTYKEVARELKVPYRIVCKRMETTRLRYNSTTNEQLIYNLITAGLLPANL